jgi:hypothetical protein
LVRAQDGSGELSPFVGTVMGAPGTGTAEGMAVPEV